MFSSFFAVVLRYPSLHLPVSLDVNDGILDKIGLSSKRKYSKTSQDYFLHVQIFLLMKSSIKCNCKLYASTYVIQALTEVRIYFLIIILIHIMTKCVAFYYHLELLHFSIIYKNESIFRCWVVSFQKSRKHTKSSIQSHRRIIYDYFTRGFYKLHCPVQWNRLLKPL